MTVLDADRVAGRTSSFPGAKNHGAASPMPSLSLTEEHVVEALQHSPDNGATLDFTHKCLSDVSEDCVEYLATVGRDESLSEESPITRHVSIRRVPPSQPKPSIAELPWDTIGLRPYQPLSRSCRVSDTSTSRTTISVPSHRWSVPTLSCGVKLSLTGLQLTLMPSLQILDISRNRIKQLPAQPGSLVNLHVLCISRNKITRLQAYLSDFTHLNILKLDHNPIEWPPKAVLEAGGSSSDPGAAKQWILSMQKWLKENSHPHSNARKPSTDSVRSERGLLAQPSPMDGMRSWPRLAEMDDAAPHARTFSVDIQSALPHESSKNVINPRERPPPLQLGQLASLIRSNSPDSYLPTPEESVSSTDDDDHTAVPEGFEHGKNSPFSRGNRDRRPAIFGKKSTAGPPSPSQDGRSGDERRPTTAKTPDSTTPLADSLANGHSTEFSIPSPLSQGQGSSSSSEDHRPPKFNGTAPSTSESPTFADRPRAVPDTERHAYFKRLSALPANAISDNLPAPLLSLLECARSLFFAVSQVYQALSHYITHTLDSRLSSVLRKITDPAYTYMMKLNEGLEEFDAIGKKARPSWALCRSLAECCRDTAAVFGKAMAILALQLNILASKDDDRYMRSLILTFYGATAEISSAWRAMVPHAEAIKSHLVEPRRVPTVKGFQGVPTGLPALEIPPASAPALGTPFGVPMARSRVAVSKGLGRSRTTRRHAGSFSSKDVEIGKSLASYDIPPPPVALSSSMPSTTLRSGLRHPPMPLPLSASTSSLAPLLMTASSTSAPSTSSGFLGSGTRNGSVHHSRQASQASLAAAPATPSPVAAPRRPTLEIPQSRTLVDEDALDAMERAVDAAPAVWEMMKELCTSMSESSEDIDGALCKAKIITERLRTNLHATRCGDPASDRKALREDAHVFVKTVVKLSNVIKAHGSTHALFPDLRAKMVSLTNSTQEFVMLLHVSSFSPSVTPRPYSPMTNGLPPHVAAIVEDNRLGASLSRSRSAQQPKALKLVAPPARELPRSALPNQTFNINPPLRHGVGMDEG
ncbi:hypothetical protein ID866_3365 [Astraeus odoratus]|nr:hypothetical protein ID866_3365 [Astraeus odoratus]